MAAKKVATPDPGVASWLKELAGGKFKEAVGAKRSLGFKKTWSKADHVKARAAIDQRFSSPGKAPTTIGETEHAPLTREHRAWADNASITVGVCEKIIASNRVSLELMEKGLVPFNADDSLVMGNNITRACHEMAMVLPSRSSARQVGSKAKGKAKQETDPVADDAGEEDNPDQFAVK